MPYSDRIKWLTAHKFFNLKKAEMKIMSYHSKYYLSVTVKQKVKLSLIRF